MKNKVIYIILFITILLSFILGTILANGLVKDKGYSINSFRIDEAEAAKEVNLYTYIVIQGGLFKNKDNVAKTLERLKPYGNPFIVEENEGSRVLLGFFKEEEATKVIAQMNKDNVPNSKILYEIKGDNLNKSEIGQIIDGLMQISSSLNKQDIDGIKTEEFKKWVKDQKIIEDSSIESTSLKKLIETIGKMGDKITKGEFENYNKVIYEVSLSYKKK